MQIKKFYHELKNANATVKLQNKSLKNHLLHISMELLPPKATLVAETHKEELENETNWFLKQKKKNRSYKKCKANSSFFTRYVSEVRL